jgi:transcriptional regulator of acetoin/glycerol metabolism
MTPAAQPGRAILDTPAALARPPGDTAGCALNPLESAERSVLLRELERHEWNLSSVARELGISRNTLYRKLQRFDIKLRDRSLFH